MRINEIILENEQLDELSAAGVGQGIGKVAGNVVRGTSDFFSGIKQGYQQARNAVPSATSQPAQPGGSGGAPAQPAAPGGSGGAPAQPAAPSPAPSNLPTVKQINQAIPTLRTRDLQSVKKVIDTAIAKKAPKPNQPAAPAPAPAPAQPAPSPAAPFQLPPYPGGSLQAVEESIYYSKFLDMKI